MNQCSKSTINEFRTVMENNIETSEQIFESRTQPEPNSGCLIWTGATNSKGYGYIWFGGNLIGAHRFAWQREYGKITDNSQVLHKCDVRSCVNVDHLFLGTIAENMADRDAKGRVAFGEKHGNSTLTKKEVLEIRRDKRSGSKIAADYGISHQNVSRIKLKQLWAHVE